MREKNDVPRNLERFLHKSENCSFFPIWHAVSRKTISSTPHGKEQERKSPQQMTVDGAITSRIARWVWVQGCEYRNGLIRPEIAHYLIKITTELADILGIELTQGK